jgi:short-subunit dehydrogenase
MLNLKFNLHKQYSLITGASGLLGEQHAIALLEINSNIILTDINYKKLVIQKKKLEKLFTNSKILICKMDVTKEKSIIRVIRYLTNKKIKLKVLINNAAIDSKVKKNQTMTNSGNFESMSINEWNRHINVGLLGATLCSKFFGNMIAKN